MKKAVVYVRRGSLFVRSCSQTTVGVWIDEGPCESLAISSSEEDIGKAVLNALSSSRSGVAHPTAWQHLNDALLDAAKVRSYSSFGRSAKCIHVEWLDQLMFVPTRNLGNTSGFIDLEERAVRVSGSLGFAEVGAGLLAALALTE